MAAFAPFALRRSAGWRRPFGWSPSNWQRMLSSGRTPSGPSPHLSSEELKWHRWIQDSVVPLLGEGVVCAMRDQPNDPAAYLAEFLAAKSGSAEMARTLSSRKLAGECARLDAELYKEADALLEAHVADAFPQCRRGGGP